MSASLSDEELEALIREQAALMDQYSASRLGKLLRRWSAAYDKRTGLEIKLKDAVKAEANLDAAVKAEELKSPESAVMQQRLRNLSAQIFEERQQRARGGAQATV